jgi:DNA polymerase-3 subunit delta
MSVYLLWVEDDFRLEKALKDLRKKIIGDETSPLNHRVLKNPDPKILLENIQTTGMMFGNLLIEIHSKKLFVRTKEKEIAKEDTDKIIDVLEALPQSVSVIFICNIDKGTGKKVDGASKIVKSLKKIGEVIEFKSFRSYDTKDVCAWIVENAKEKGLVIRSDAAMELFIGVGEDLRRLDSEIDKLELLVYPEKTITKKMVEALGLSTDNIFTFAEVLVSKNKSKSYAELGKLLEKDEPLRILAFLQSAFNKWILLKSDAKNMSYFEISKKHNMHEYRVQKELEKLASMSLDELILMQKKLTDTEFKIKSGKVPGKLAMEIMI